MENNFNTIYEELKEKLKDDISVYKKNVRKSISLATLIVAIILIAILLVLRNFTALYPFLIILAIIFLAIVCVSLKTNEYNSILKYRILNILAQSYNPTCKFDNSPSIDSKIYKDSTFNIDFDRIVSEDCLNGVLNNECSFTFQEISVQKKVKNNKGKIHFINLFHGIFCIVELPIIFSYDLKVIKNDISNNLWFKRKNKLEMDSTSFEKVYDVYCNNKIAGMQVFTADTMQKILDFKEKYKMYPEISLKKNNLYMRFPIFKNCLEHNIFKNILDYKEIESFYILISSIINISENFSNDVLDLPF